MIKKIFNSWKKLPVSAKSSIAFIFCSFFLKGVAFITTPIFTRIMNTTEYGVVATYNSWVSIIEIFAILGLTSAGVFNVGLNDNRDNRNRFISQCLGLCNFSTIVFFSFIAILKIFLGNNFLLSNKLLLIMFFHFLFSPAQIFWVTRQRYEYKYKLATLITIVSIVISQILSIIFICFVDSDQGYIKILTNEIGTLIFAIPIYLIILRKGKDYINFYQWKKILVFAIPLLPHYMAQHVMASADRIMISDMVSSSDAGIYNVVSNIGMVANIFWNSINASLVPITFECINKKSFSGLRKIVNSLLLVYFVVCIFIVLIAPEFLCVLAPKEYYFGIYAIPPLTVVVFSQALYNIYANVEFYYKMSKRIALSTVVAAIVNFGLNYIFIPKFSFIAASYTTLFSYLTLVLMHYLGYKKCDSNQIYDNKFVLTLLLFLVIISIFCNLLYVLPFLRYLLVIVLLFIIIFNYKKILNIVKSLKK